MKSLMALVTVAMLGATTLPAGLINDAAAKYVDDFAPPGKRRERAAETEREQR